jgi:hypothetical protein
MDHDPTKVIRIVLNQHEILGSDAIHGRHGKPICWFLARLITPRFAVEILNRNKLSRPDCLP